MRINIEDFIKILTLFILIEMSEKYKIDPTISIITAGLSITDWHIYDIWIKNFKKENINRYNLFIGLILYIIYNYNPVYVIWFFIGWLLSELINIKT